MAAKLSGIPYFSVYKLRFEAQFLTVKIQPQLMHCIAIYCKSSVVGWPKQHWSRGMGPHQLNAEPGVACEGHGETWLTARLVRPQPWPHQPSPVSFAGDGAEPSLSLIPNLYTVLTKTLNFGIGKLGVTYTLCRPIHHEIWQVGRLILGVIVFKEQYSKCLELWIGAFLVLYK